MRLQNRPINTAGDNRVNKQQSFYVCMAGEQEVKGLSDLQKNSEYEVCEMQAIKHNGRGGRK